MTELTIYETGDEIRRLQVTSAPREIADSLRDIGVRYEVWGVRDIAAAETADAAVLASYQPEIERLKAEGGYTVADIVRLQRGTPNTGPMRAKFLSEHIHSEDEVRFFTEGAGAFYLRGEKAVFRMVCGAGDLLSVPAKTRHWFDMGPDPYFTAVRLFTNPEGWVAQFTGDAIASRIPEFEG